jgi:hypothetical protein
MNALTMASRDTLQEGFADSHTQAEVVAICAAWHIASQYHRDKQGAEDKQLMINPLSLLAAAFGQGQH